MHNSIIVMKNDNVDNPETMGILAEDEKDGAAKPVAKLGETKTKSILTTEDIPQLVGQIAELVKSHFQSQIDGIIGQVNTLKLQMPTVDAIAKEALAKAAKTDSFSETIYTEFRNHRHSSEGE